MTLLEASNALDVAEVIIERIPHNLSRAAKRVYLALCGAAVEVGAERGYVSQTSQVSLFCPAEQVAAAVGYHRSTVYRAAAELVDLGLIDYRGHHTTLRSRTVSDGTVWCVRLQPVGGCKARLGHSDMKATYRNLAGDIEVGRTSWAFMRQSKDNPSKGLDLQKILVWALTPVTEQNPVTNDCRMNPRQQLEALLDVPHAPVEERSRVVELAAEAVAMALNDRNGENFYRRLLWQLLRASQRAAGDHFYAVYLAAVRAQVDSAEGFARKPGALFVSRLKAAPWWNEVMNGPPTRIGTAPLKA